MTWTVFTVASSIDDEFLKKHLSSNEDVPKLDKVISMVILSESFIGAR